MDTRATGGESVEAGELEQLTDWEVRLELVQAIDVFLRG